MQYRNLITYKMKNLIKKIRERKRRADVAFCLTVFASCVALLLSALLQGCIAQRVTESKGKSTIITTDTTYIYHGGMIKFSKMK